MEQPLVSVIMGVFNQWDEKILRESVNSILNQTYANLEFMIWDDGSHPDAARFVQKLPGLDRRIHVAGKENNRGLAYSLNECIRHARGKYIARMDADDISKPFRIEKQVSYLETHPEYGWCGTGAELFDEHGVWGNRTMPEIPQKRDYFRYSPYIHPSVMFRAELFDENTGYLASEETLRCEDYEIFMNLTGRGLQGYNLQENLFCYRETRDSYKKRKAEFRLNEAKIRYRNFKKMGWLFPVAACQIPTKVLDLVKRYEGTRAKRMEGWRKFFGKPGGISETAGVLQSLFAEKPPAYAGSGKCEEK